LSVFGAALIVARVNRLTDKPADRLLPRSPRSLVQPARRLASEIVPNAAVGFCLISSLLAALCHWLLSGNRSQQRGMAGTC
jgi:hypothetical protein